MPKLEITLGPAEVLGVAEPERTPLENVALFVISEVLGSLPNNRDWLDPELEKFAKSLLVKVDYTPQLTPLEAELLAAIKAHQAFVRGDNNPFGHDCQWCGDCHQRTVDMQIRAVKKAEGR